MKHDPDMNAAPALSQVLADHAAAISWADLPQSVHLAFRRALVDYLAVVAAGLSQPPAVAVRALAEAQAGRPVATLIGTAQRASVQDAAFANGTAAHALDFDDGHREGSAHPGGVIFSTALAVAEAEGSDWLAFAEAVVAGYEVMLRIAASIHPTSAGQGWHNSSVAGVFGAVAAAGRLMGLDAATIAQGFGLAGSFAGGIREYLYDGADVKRLHLGKAARDGILCAELARRGVTGAQAVFEGRNGLFRAMAAGRGKADRLVRGLGQDWEFPQVYFKPYPCCRHFQAAIDATLALKAEHSIAPERVSSIEIGLYGPGVSGHEHVTAQTLLDAQMSAPCAIATTLLHGHPGVAQFDPAGFDAPDMQRLLARTRVFTDAECDAEYPARRTAVVRLTLDDATVLERRIRDPKGEAENPLGDDEIGQKFLENAGSVFGQAKAASLLSDIRADAFAGGKVAALTARLTPESATA